MKLRKLKKHTRLRKITTVTGLTRPFPKVTETVTSAGRSRLSGEAAHKLCKDTAFVSHARVAFLVIQLPLTNL